ncbi:MAG TPA: Coenzyme F420 hydrogenase/dehydrogenase, beta subunit C-terminal domain [Candidatus Coprenecus pullicola]|nr:Coenzyme F420 hydrogenase/dehydrogenase, beta subunit C-terminal domain [Candidatus Coprenecus pullicola]
MKEIRHITITDPHDCCGCTACSSACPRGSITMKENSEGFLYPSVDGNTCIECGLCVKVCPVISQSPVRRPIEVYAVKHPDGKIREGSASGGAFPLLASAILEKGGMIFGSRYDNNHEAVHDSAATPAEAAAFTGSKYLQSRMEDCYSRVRTALREGLPVLFTGTPCQVAGLNHFLASGAGKVPTERLVTVDLICHGAPSPGVWRKYLAEEMAAMEARGYSAVTVDEVRFRDKEDGKAGWKGYNFKIFFSATDPSGAVCHPVLSEKGKAGNLFIRGFLSDFYSRPSCYRCPAREFRSGSDITIGDFWGIGDLRPDFDDDRGVSAVLINTEKGRRLFSSLSCDKLQMTYGDVLRRNRCLETSVAETEKRKAFFLACPDLSKGSAASCDIHDTVRKLL